MPALTLKDLEQRIAQLEAHTERLEVQNERRLKDIGSLMMIIEHNRISFDKFVEFAHDSFGGYKQDDENEAIMQA